MLDASSRNSLDVWIMLKNMQECSEQTHTFHSDNMHALDRVQWAQACIDRSVDDSALLTAGNHDSACSTASLSTPKLCSS